MYKNKKMGKKTNPGPRRGSARPCLVSRIMVTSCLGGSGPVSLSRVTIAGHKLLLRQLRGKLPPLILRTPGLLLSGQGETIICPSSPFRACHVSLGGPIKNAQTPFLSWSGTAAETRSVCAECPRCVRQLYSGSCECFLEIHPWLLCLVSCLRQSINDQIAFWLLDHGKVIFSVVAAARHLAKNEKSV